MTIEFSLLELFRAEVETHAAPFVDNLLQLENDPANADLLDALMRAAHSIKGAAKLVGVEPVVKLAHVVEEIFVQAKAGNHSLSHDDSDRLLAAIDKIKNIAFMNDDHLSAYDCDADQDYLESRRRIESILHPAQGSPASAGDGRRSEAAGAAAVGDHKGKHKDMDADMLDLFRTEVQQHGETISAKLMQLEGNVQDPSVLENLMRSSHSIKGAARLVGIDAIVRMAHVMEDVFVAAQKNEYTITSDDIDLLLETNDRMMKLSSLPVEEMTAWPESNATEYAEAIAALNRILKKDGDAQPQVKTVKEAPAVQAMPPVRQEQAARNDNFERVLRITSDRWDLVMGLAGEIMVESGWLHPYLTSLLGVKNRQVDLIKQVELLREHLRGMDGDHFIGERLQEIHQKLSESRHYLTDQIAELDLYEQRITNLSARLHKEAISTRMRPFSDGVHGFQRMVRDISRSLAKSVRFEVRGENTQVDREVLEKMEAPLNHIIRNALDHGIETREQRVQSGKSDQATIVLSACHAEGMLLITVEDDGRGIDAERIRQKIVQKGLTTEDMASAMNKEELLEFLFLPSFSTRDQVTELSGRGVGLDVVMNAIQTMRGSVKIQTEIGKGTKFLLRLPLTLSVIHALVVEISGDYYAFPLSRIVRALKVPMDEIRLVEDRQYIECDGHNIGIIGASRVLELEDAEIEQDHLPIVVISDHSHTYGVAVSRFIGQRELAVRKMDPRIGKIQDISSCSMLEDGSSVLIIDTDDMVQSIHLLAEGGRIGKIHAHRHDTREQDLRRILIVDDSLTVREVERKLLEAYGYLVDVAVDGMDGWNAVRTQSYDLVISDIDMPRMDGIELVRQIKAHSKYNEIPVIIVSYKDRAEDRRRGMEAGADYYLTKGSFHDDSFLNAVHDLIGEAVG